MGFSIYSSASLRVFQEQNVMQRNAYISRVYTKVVDGLFKSFRDMLLGCILFLLVTLLGTLFGGSFKHWGSMVAICTLHVWYCIQT